MKFVSKVSLFLLLSLLSSCYFHPASQALVESTKSEPNSLTSDLGLILPFLFAPTPPVVVNTVFQVSSTSPANGETNVPRASGIVIDFNRDVNTATVNQGIGFVAPSDSNTITSLSQQNTSARRITLRPNNVFDAGGTYSITIRNTVRDTSGQALNENYTFSFTAAR